LDATRATTKLRKKCPGKVSFQLSAKPDLLVLGTHSNRRDNYTEGQTGNNAWGFRREIKGGINGNWGSM